MKKYLKLCILSLLIVTIPMVLTACKSAEEKVSEKAGEALVEQVTGAEVDIDGDEVKLETEDGSFVAGENLEWPGEVMGNLPVPKADISCVMKDNNSTICTVGLSNFEKAEAEKYFETLKGMGFKGGLTAVDADSLILTGTRDDGTSINFVYNPDPKEATIAFDRGEQ